MFQRFVVIACALVLSIGFLRAQGAQDRSQAVMPWVTEDTVYVAMISLDGVNLDTGGKWVTDAAAKLVDPAEAEQSKGDITKAITFVRGLREELKSAGVKDAYWLLEASPRRGEQVFFVIPAGANADAIAAKLKPMLGRGMTMSVEQGAAVLQLDGTPAERKPRADRPDIAAALAGRDAPVVLAFSLPQELRMQMPPQLPPQMGGAELAPIQDGFMWGVAELRFTPEPAVSAFAQMDGAENAKAAVELIQTTLEAATETRHREAAFLAVMGKWLMPSVKEDRLVIDLPSAKLNEGIAEVAAPMRQARAQATQVRSASQIRQLLMGVHMFANKNNSAAPDQLEQVAEHLGGPDAMKWLMTNPLRPQKTPGYIYVKQSLGGGAGSTEKVMLYESYDTWPGGINVGYADGHVEWIADEAAFLAQLKASGGSK